MLEAVLASKPGKRYYAIPAGQFVPTQFVSDHDGQLVLDVHLGWPARDGQLIARRNGRPVTCAAHHEMTVQPERADHIACTLEPDTLSMHERLYQNAGLVAYRETFDRVVSWPEAQRDRVVATAVRKLPRLAPAGTECNQIALYDVTSEQWHFTSTDALDAL
ncbi:hypothetical protein [Burkholderia glumae]|nr:hypothetical protein [Burkholderia glumae]MCM2542670.1 hypothetical protein [Burkholderia glumae]